MHLYNSLGMKPELTKPRLRVAFFGRGQLGLDVLIRLIENELISVVLVVVCDASSDVPLGKEPFKNLASANNIKYMESNRINEPQFIDYVRTLDVDLGVAMLWLYTINSGLIDSIKHGILNLHGGMLPRFRGNACQAWAILTEESSLGVTCHLMEPGSLDSGPIVLQKVVPINTDSKVGELMDEVSRCGTDLVIESVLKFVHGAPATLTQDSSKALYCYPRLPRDGEIDWNSSSAEILKLVRSAGPPYEGAYSYYRGKLDGKLHKLVILDASVEDYPSGEYYAVPGHVLKLNTFSAPLVVCGDKRLLYLKSIQIDDENVEPAASFRSVRQRLGLDISREIVSLWSAINELSPS